MKGTPYAQAASLFRNYVGTAVFLDGTAETSLQRRADGMLRNRLTRAALTLDVDIDAVVSRVLGLARARAKGRPAPVYVAGLGGSGSHWLTGMLAEILPVVNLEEVPVPPDLDMQLEALPVGEQGFLIDCLHLSYASAVLGYGTFVNLVGARILHSAIRVIEPRHKAWDPECFVIYLLRDPRDQAACFAFRKEDFRKRHYPDASDEQYLAGCAANNAHNYSETRRSPVRPDFVCRYEELKASAPKVLERLAAAISHPVTAETAARAARAHDASQMRSGRLPHKGNLYPYESHGWQEEANERQKLILHSHLTEVVTAAEYPADECLGRPLTIPAARRPRRLVFPDDDSLGVLFVREEMWRGGGGWRRLCEARGEVTVEFGLVLKLRVGDEARREAIESLQRLPGDGLDSLCLAGNQTLDDELLKACLGTLSDLYELDLSATGITTKGTSAIVSLRRLAGLNLYQLDLSSDAISDLRHALPDQAIIAH